MTVAADKKSASKDIKLTQTKNGWQTAENNADANIAGKSLSGDSAIPSSGTVTVTVNDDGTWTCEAAK